MGEWDEYCTVCGGPPHVDFDDVNNEEGTPPPPNPADDYTWLESFVGISNKEELIPLASNSYWVGAFDIQPGHTSLYDYFSIGCRDKLLDEKTARGYACHVACYNLLQQELNYTLKYADLLPLLADNEYDHNHFSWSDYGGLAEYQEQWFVDVQLVKHGKVWMIEDPSRNAQNKERILQLWRPLVESGFKRPEDARVGHAGNLAPEIARVGDAGSLAPEIAKMNLDKAKA